MVLVCLVLSLVLQRKIHCYVIIVASRDISLRLFESFMGFLLVVVVTDLVIVGVALDSLDDAGLINVHIIPI